MPPASKLSSDLPALAKRLASEGPVKTLPTPRRIRLVFNGQTIADTTSALAVWEHEYYPQYFLPVKAFKTQFVKPSDDVEDGGSAVARLWRIEVNDRSTDEAFEMLKGKLAGYVRVLFDAMDHWLEEDTPIYVHPKDPFKRIDIIHSTRRIRVRVGGKVVADTNSSMHLFETGLPPRYYMPLSAVDQSVLKPTKLRTKCPYKGEAEYYSIIVDGKDFKDIVWYYTHPTIECTPIQGMVCFYNEKVDIEIGGKAEDRPETVWS
ncbi:hypothetical protein ANO11243_072570 [Dothideomycetidae sp. 11243]|nr:hypothetical protein ANO11243_072570 [fungal sp. No.11243]